MPIMPRINRKVRNITFAILGKPSNYSSSNKKMRRIDRVIISQNSRFDY